MKTNQVRHSPRGRPGYDRYPQLCTLAFCPGCTVQCELWFVMQTHLSRGLEARCSGMGLHATGHTLLLKTKAEKRKLSQEGDHIVEKITKVWCRELTLFPFSIKEMT